MKKAFSLIHTEKVNYPVSIMAAAGVDIYCLSHYMGHGSIEITIKRYTHLCDEQRSLDAQATTNVVLHGDSRA